MEDQNPLNNPAIANAIAQDGLDSPVIKAILAVLGIEDIQIFEIDISTAKDGVVYFPRAFSRKPNIIIGQSVRNLATSGTGNYELVNRVADMKTVTEKSFTSYNLEVYAGAAGKEDAFFSEELLGSTGKKIKTTFIAILLLNT